MSKYYILKKNTFEGLTLTLPTEDFDQSGSDGWLGLEPFSYNTYEEAEKIKDCLNLIFKGKSKSTKFIIVEEK